MLACFPVYRSYLPDGASTSSRRWRPPVEHRPDLGAALDALAPVLADPEHPAARRFQQTSGMVMAKGVEDCAFYRYSRLTSLNEVGGDPAVFSVTPDEFHDAMAVRQRDWPLAMTTTTTHDTKRSEDTRARIAVLAEVPDVWETALDRLLDLAPLPDPGFGSLLWQAVVGAWPASRERLHQYAEKAMREAGDHTTWTDPDAAYEGAVHAAVDAAFDSAEVRGGRRRSGGGHRRARPQQRPGRQAAGADGPGRAGRLPGHRALGPQPGRPRQPPAGRLRRPGRAARRRRATPSCASPRRPCGCGGTGPSCSRRTPPCSASGPAADHVLAFDRGGAVTVVTRLPVGLERRGGWGDTTLRARRAAGATC